MEKPYDYNYKPSLKTWGLYLLVSYYFDGWAVSSDIARMVPDGKTSYTNALNELIEAGWIRTERNREKDGTYGPLFLFAVEYVDPEE